MGYSIYYDRAFIRVDDKYIPMVQSGASNCAEYVKGRLVADKNWEVLNVRRSDRVLFSQAEILEIAKDYERISQESGMCFKSRNKPFGSGEFERWIVGGMKKAYSIDEYSSFGNRLFVVDFPDGRVKRWRTQPFHTSEQLMSIISEFKTGWEFDISFSNREVIRPTARKTQERGNVAARDSTPFADTFGTVDAAPAIEKSSVLGQIAEAREGQQKIIAAPKTHKKTKSQDPEL